MKKGIIFIGMGFELLGLVLGGWMVGQAIDKEMGWDGYGIAGVIICSLVAWMFHLVVLLKKFMADNSDEPTDSQSS